MPGYFELCNKINQLLPKSPNNIYWRKQKRRTAHAKGGSLHWSQGSVEQKHRI